MLQSPREKFLAILFGGSMAAFGLWETIGHIILQPLTNQQAAVDAAQSANVALVEQSTTVEHALKNLKQLAGRSLPAEPGKACVLYQGWLIRLLDRSSITSSTVTPAPAIVEKGIGHRIPLTVQCTASTANIAQFLDQFYATPLLHRITNLNISSTSDGQADHRVTLSIEALAFDSAQNIDSLPDPVAVEEQSSLLTTLSHDDIFRRALPVEVVVATEYEPTVTTAEPTPEPTPAPPNPLSSVRFVASVWNGQQREAWFFDQRSNAEVSLLASAELVLPDIQGRVLSIQSDSLQMELAGQRCRISLGQTLNDVAASP